MKKPSRSVLWCGGVCAALFLGLAAWFCWCLRDEPPPDDHDLVLTPPAVAPEANAWTYYSATTNIAGFARFYCQIRVIGFDDARRYVADKPAAAELVPEEQEVALFAENRALVDLLERGADCTVCVPPVGVSSESVDRIEPAFVGAVLLCRVRLRRACCRHDFVAASNALARLARLRHQLDAAFPTMYDEWIAPITGVMCRDVQMLLDDPALPPGFLDVLPTFIPSPDAWRHSFAQLVRRAYMYYCDRLIAPVVREGVGSNRWSQAVYRFPFPSNILPDRFLFHPNATLRRLGEQCRGIIAESRKPRDRCSDLRPVAPPRFNVPDWLKDARVKISNILDWLHLSEGMGEGPVDDRPMVPPVPNGLGRLFTDDGPWQIVGVFPQFPTLYYRMLSTLALAQEQIACRRFKRDNGAWPKTLGELVPKYLDAVPANPDNGQPLEYDPAIGPAPVPKNFGYIF